MTKRFVLAITALFTMRVADSSAATIEYALTPRFVHEVLTAIDVSLSFRGNASGVTALRLPNSVTGETELWRTIENIEVKGARVDPVDDPAQRTLHHSRNAPITVRYRISRESSGGPNARRPLSRPIVQANYFHFLGAAALIVPNIDAATPLRIKVRKLPRSWKFASNLQHKGTTLSSATFSVLLGGEIQVLRPSASNPSLRVALQGDWASGESVIADRARKIIEGQRRFWGDAPSPYLVTLLQRPAIDMTLVSRVRGGGGTGIIAGGTALDESFAMSAPENVDDYSVVYVLAHESMHAWIVNQQGALTDEDRGHWLTEGFTEFYKSRLLVRDGVWTAGDFAVEINKVLRAYAKSAVRTVGNDYIAANFFKDPDVADQAYQRGRLLALIWDARLQTKGGLDPIMHVMRLRAKAAKGETNPDALEMLIEETAKAGVDIRADIAKYIEHGDFILLPEDLLAPCGRIETQELAEFDRGFDLQATISANMHLTSVRTDSSAYKAGLRDGMRLIKLELGELGELGDSEKELVYRVEDNGVERAIRYLPRGNATVKVQQLVLDKSLNNAELEHCRQTLAGR